MQKAIKRLLKDNSLTFAIIVTIGIAFLSLYKIGKISISISNLDKIEHAFAYLVLSFFWLLSSAKVKVTHSVIIIGCIFFGILMELLQTTLTTYRYAEFADVIADVLGIICGFYLFKAFLKENAVKK